MSNKKVSDKKQSKKDCNYQWGDSMISHGCILEQGHKLPHICDCGNKSYGTKEERKARCAS